MSWGEVQVGEEVNIMVRFGELVLQCKAVVREEAVLTVRAELFKGGISDPRRN